MPTIRLANHSSVPFTGWKRTTIDYDPPHEAGTVGNATTGVGFARFICGRRIGLTTRVVDVFVSLPPGGRLELDLAGATPFDFTPGALPANPLVHFGGPVTIGGVPLDFVGMPFPDGAGWSVHMRARAGAMLCTNVWLTWYPDQPGWCSGEATVVASNPGVPDMGEAIPAGFALRFGDAIVRVPGLAFGAALLPEGTYLADGQGKSFPLTFVWLRHLHTTADWASAGAIADLGIGAVGISSLLSDGNPLMPIGFDALQWATPRLPAAVARLHTWEPPVVGPAVISGSAGEQEDSTFHPGGEAVSPDGAGAEAVRYLSALKLYSERPCNHLEADGTPLDTARHPSLLFWDGRVHWHTGVSPDRLGKPRNLTAEEAHTRWGPDVQHTYVGTLFSPARLTGSPACQQLLRNLCTVYLLQRTANPAWSTSAYESAREWGCEGVFVVDVWRDLEDRAMAARVVQRWKDRVANILLPRMAGKDLLVVWVNDPRVNPVGEGAQWWQESFASYSIDRACEMFGLPEGREVALRVARRVLDVAWRWFDPTMPTVSRPDAIKFADPDLQAIHEARAAEDSIEDAVAEPHWRAQPQGPIDGSANPENPSTDSFNSYAMPLCLATVLRHEPTNAKALAIWAQLLAGTGETARRWMPPGVLVGSGQ